jgi:hypothetical protein
LRASSTHARTHTYSPTQASSCRRAAAACTQVDRSGIPSACVSVARTQHVRMRPSLKSQVSRAHAT